VDRYRRPHRRVHALALAAAAACLACGNGPLDAASKTSYATDFNFAFDNADSTVVQNHSLSVTGFLVITVEGTSLEFDGSYVYLHYPAGAGTMRGAIDLSGNITMTQFGDPGAALGATLAFLQNNWPNCDFTRATPLPYSGSANDGALTLTGGLTVPCTYTINQQQTTLLTTMTEVVAGGQTGGSPSGETIGVTPLGRPTSTRF
jgi:hypothetical protein